jgi:hypothetical protein
VCLSQQRHRIRVVDRFSSRLLALCGQDEWKGQLDTIVKKVSDAFSQYYEEIGCKGTFNLDMSMLTLVA